jgi:hypothetical protein
MEVERNWGLLDERFEGLGEFRVTRDFVLVYYVMVHNGVNL